MLESLLTGIRIAEVSAFVAGPLAGATLAGLGAEVIRIEQLGGGIDAHRWPLHEGRSLYREGLDRGKRSVTLDLRSERGRELASDLVAAAGIIVTNLPDRGWMAYEKLRLRRPDLIMVVISGDLDGGAAVDYTVNAGIGFPALTGPEEGTLPVNHLLPAWDIAAGLLAGIALLTAERHRSRTGDGQLVRLALADVALAMASHLGFIAEAELVAEPRRRTGNYIYGTYGRDFATADGRRVMVCALTPRQWSALGSATGLTDAFAGLEREQGADFSQDGDRFLNRHGISGLLAPWIAARRQDEVARIFNGAEVLWGPYRTFKEMLAADPRAASPPASPLRFRATEPGAPAAAPAPPQLGADTEMVLASLLGMDFGAITQLRGEGVID